MTTPDTDGPLSVSVVICAFTEHRLADLTAAIDALRGQSRPADQVILVIDHNEVLLRLARSAWAPGAEILTNQGAPGLSDARNTGVAAATGAVIAFLDDDATPEPDWLEHLVAPFADPRVVAVGGAAIPRWESARPRWWPAEFDWVVGCTYRGMPTVGGEVRNVLGATMAFRADVFAGGEGFSLVVGRVGASATGCEETELCIRLRQHRPDASILFEPRAVVHHRVTPARERFAYFARRTFAEGRSKAAVARLVGARDALSTERSYVARTLPAGVGRGLVSTCWRGDLSGAARAGAISIGFLLTATGYGLGRVGGLARPASASEDGDFVPIRLVQLELTDPSPPAAAPGYRRARVLVRSEGRPVGTTDVPLDEGRVGPVAEARIREDFGSSTPRPSPTVASPRAIAPGVSVVVATHDRPRELQRCLDSLLATHYPCLQVIVVDNAPSSSVTRDMVQHDYPTVTYVHEDVAGLARAHNRGLQHVAAPVVAFTDDDVVVDPSWVRSLAAQFSSDRVGCVTGLIWPAELETPGQAMIEAHGGFGKGFATRTFDLDGSRPDDPLFPYTAGALGSGANMAFRTDVLRELGGFDPALGAGSRGRGGDDLAAFLDVIEAGYSLVYEPAAIVHHHHRREAGDARTQALNYGIGLGAYLTRAVSRRPSSAIDFLRLAPRAVVHLVASSSAGDPGLGADRVRRLLPWQLLGLVRGPFVYARSAREARRAPQGAS
ncbi:glycosyltransferase family 2 protein [Nocardioides sp. Soil777]|uniref:glycosyltransferase family 2 protein n=1 Tax=Nocardioides sp. Soil777 TaxID=1736409 RepID=UPI0009E9A961|nr:glycosyltransferase family 2 protein [Nocardioides sp. Soil777]